MTTSENSTRFVHLSDIHIAVSGSVWKPGDWRSKRMSAWFNLRVLGRGRRFRSGEQILQRLRQDWAERSIDWVIFSGDASALGHEEEVSRAAELLGVGADDGLPGIAVPGNHDYFTVGDVASGVFERYFASWQEGQRLDKVYPFAQKVNGVWLVGVNSASANRWAWDSRGRVGEEQLERLTKLLATLDDGPRILVTHYPVCLADGKPEEPFRRLRDLSELLEVAKKGDIRLWLHGHRHKAYVVRSEQFPFPIVCAGSATQKGAWSHLEYTLTGTTLTAKRRVFDPAQAAFAEAESFTVELD